MPLSLSTHWNAHRHSSGEEMVDEILKMGFEHIELGYNLRVDLVPGVKSMVQNGSVRVTSVHNYCPVPMGAPGGHPELFLFGSKYARERSSAVLHTLNTVRFAGDVQASCVVIHAGRVAMRHFSRQLMEMAENGDQNSMKYEKLKQKMLTKRERKAPRQLDYIRECLTAVLPRAADAGVKLGLENLPSWEAMPCESEMEQLAAEFASEPLGFWYDVGHGQIRENLGWVGSTRWLERLQHCLVGMHVHDVQYPTRDHVMPPAGSIDYSLLKPFFSPNLPLVLEPAPNTPTEQVVTARRFIENLLQEATARPADPPPVPADASSEREVHP